MTEHGVKLANDGGIAIQQEGASLEAPKDEAPVETPKTEANGTKPPVETGDEFPSELIEGKAEVPKEDPDAVFKEPAKGPVKHEHFERVQKAALDRVTAIKAEADSLRAELAKAKTGSTALPEEHIKTVEALKAERDTLLERLGEADYARTPEFESKFTKREQGIAASLIETAEAAGADKETISSLLHVPLKRRMALLDEAELNPSARGRIDALLVRYDEIQGEKGAELADWKTKSASRQQEQAAQEHARSAAEERQYDEALKEITSEIFEKDEPFRVIEGQTKWNETAERNRANVAEIVKGNLSPKAVVRAAVHAAGYETLLGMFRKAQATAKAQATELAKYRGNTPKPGDGVTPRDTGEPDISKMSDAEASRYNWNKAMRSGG